MPPKVTGLRRNTARVRAALAASGFGSRAAESVAQSPPLRVLGLDVNTASTGVAVVDECGRVRLWDAVATSQFASSDVLSVADTLDAALSDVRAAVEREAAGEQVEWAVGIEAFLRLFRPGRFHNAGLLQLAQLNGIVSFASWRRFGTRPTHTHPSAARGFFGIATSSSAAKTAIKTRALAFAQREQPQAFAAAESFALSKRTGRHTDAAFDAADAYVMAAYTRCLVFQTRLQRRADLRDAFASEYLAITAERRAARSPRQPALAEERALDAMSDEQRGEFLGELFETGVADWLRVHYDELLAPRNEAEGE